MISKFLISHCCILSSQFVRQIECEDYSFIWTPGPKGLLAEGYFTEEIYIFFFFLKPIYFSSLLSGAQGNRSEA